MRYWAAIVTIFYGLSGIMAADIALSASENSIKYNVFGTPEQVIHEIKSKDNSTSLKAPDIDCNDANLISQVRQKISSIQKSNNQENIIERRRRKMIVKNIGAFKEIDVTNFSPSANYRTANRIIDVKINNQMKDSSLKLCESDNPILERKVYLLMYEYNSFVRVEIINLTSADTKEESFIFIQK